MNDNRKEIPKNNDVQILADQIKKRIKDVEANINAPISYSVGKGSREVVILAQPLHQETTMDRGDKIREIKRIRYLTVGDNGVGAIDFITDVKFDATDNPSAVDNGKFYGHEQKYIYPAEGIFIDISKISTKNNDEGFLRNIRGLNGIDKLSPISGPGGNVNITMHDNDGLGSIDGQPVLSIGTDFRSSVSKDVEEAEFMEALRLSTEISKSVPMTVDVPSQTTMMSSILNKMS